MIEILNGFPDNVVAVDCRDRITRADYERGLIPLVEKKLREHRKLRLYYQAGPTFKGIEPGAVLADAKLGLEHLSRWERAAIVTDIDWLKFLTVFFGFLVPCPVKYFGNADETQAKAWITDPRRQEL